ncbi:MAG: SIMPL domain-containing protein [Candidatus Eisenbacteria bacterium]|nr:SIMPL domain-containing protein [Candidatus Eisenbacteria bacterium]
MKNGSMLPSLILALGLALAGWFVGHGFLGARTVERFVTVKGVSERDVQADEAFWQIQFVSADDDLGRAQDKIEKSKSEIIAFLKRHGVDSSQTELQRLAVTDVLADPYRSERAGSRFIIRQTLMVRSDNPKLIQAASQKVGELVDAGVVAEFGEGPTFLFTRLNDIKPQMIAEATANARKGAEQFALDSHSRLSGIRRANQGVFEILPRDRVPGVFEGNQLAKTVRVVATVDYYLKN